MTRFLDEGRYLQEFLDEAWVLCPSCESPGVVIATVPYWDANPRFTCTQCTLRLEGRRTRWFGPGKGIAKRPCGRCRKPLVKEIDGRAAMLDQLELVCPDCDARSLADVRWNLGPFETPHEPSFGLILQLQAPCAGHTLWAYNPTHLRFIQEFVAAQLRERVPKRNASLASRLPQWIKSAGNRSEVLKVIERLQKASASR